MQQHMFTQSQQTTVHLPSMSGSQRLQHRQPQQQNQQQTQPQRTLSLYEMHAEQQLLHQHQQQLMLLQQHHAQLRYALLNKEHQSPQYLQHLYQQLQSVHQRISYLQSSCPIQLSAAHLAAYRVMADRQQYPQPQHQHDRIHQPQKLQHDIPQKQRKQQRIQRSRLSRVRKSTSGVSVSNNDISGHSTHSRSQVEHVTTAPILTMQSVAESQAKLSSDFSGQQQQPQQPPEKHHQQKQENQPENQQPTSSSVSTSSPFEQNRSPHHGALPQADKFDGESANLYDPTLASAKSEIGSKEETVHISQAPQPALPSALQHAMSSGQSAWSKDRRVVMTSEPSPARGSRPDSARSSKQGHSETSPRSPSESVAGSKIPITPLDAVSSSSSSPRPSAAPSYCSHLEKSASSLGMADEDADDVNGDFAHSGKSTGGTKHRIIKVGRFKCPWTGCCHQRARLGYGWIRDLETHLRSLACGRSGVWKPKFNHSRLPELIANYGPSGIAVPRKDMNSEDIQDTSGNQLAAPVSSTASCDAKANNVHDVSIEDIATNATELDDPSPVVESDQVVFTTSSSLDENRFRQIVRQEAQEIVERLLAPLASQLADIHRIVMPIAGVNFNVAGSGPKMTESFPESVALPSQGMQNHNHLRLHQPDAGHDVQSLSAPVTKRQRIASNLASSQVLG